MDPSSEVDRVLQQLRDGDASAADELFSRFSGQLCRLVQSKLGWRYSRKFDPEDIAQSVFKSFIGMQARQDMTFANWDALWGLLSLVAVRKCGHRVDYLRAACRDVAREQSVVLDRGDVDRSRTELEALSREPSPAQAAMLSEALDELLRPLDERDRQIATLALQGHNTAEISERVARSMRTVQRVLDRIRTTLTATADSIC